jgi:hypothetical protein
VGVANAGGGALYTIATSDLLGRMPIGTLSLASGILACAQSASYVVVMPLIGRAVDTFGNYDAVSITLGFWVVPGAVLWLLWRPPLKLVARGDA